MQTLFQNAAPPPPLYLRCEPVNGRLAIELKLDLVSEITAQIEAVSGTPVEIGGILIGVLPTEANPILRINEVQMLARRAGDQAIFLPDPREHDQFVLARWEAGNRGRAPVGFFRTHLRGGPMKPSLADRTLLAGEFDTTAYALLLIDPVGPRMASFFTGSGGELSERPSTTPFRFEPATLGSLPVHEADKTSRSDGSDTSRGDTFRTDVSAPLRVHLLRPGRRGMLLTAGLTLALTLAAATYAWADVQGRGLLGFAAAADPHLSVTGNPVLRITWNPKSASVESAGAGELTIEEGESQRDVVISADELRSGAIEFQSTAKTVRVTLTLEMRNVNVTQAAVWRRQ